MNIPSQAEYELSETRVLHARLRAAEEAPLAERQEARNEWSYSLREQPLVVAERVRWLLNGDYGYGAMKSARSCLIRRGNTVAQLSQGIANLEWRCPAPFAREAWNSLTQPEQTKVNSLIAAVIAEWKRETAAV
jgi:hypothetical protein